MIKWVKWFHYKAPLRTKIILYLVFVQGLVLIFFGVYAYSVGFAILEGAAPKLSDSEYKAFVDKYLPQVISCVVMAFVLYIGSIILGLMLTKQYTERMKKLARQADAVASGDLTTVPYDEVGEDEIGVVHNSIAKMSQTLVDKINEANMANAAKTSFLSRMSHDIRTPMNAVRGMVEIIKRNPEDSVRVNDCIKKIDISTNHLLVLLDEMLDMSKLQSGELEITSESFDLSEALDQCYKIVESQAEDRDVHVYIEKAELKTTKIVGCELYTKRIITNLLSNAIKFNRDGGSVTVDITERKIDRMRVVYSFVIEDSGIGMSKEFMEKAFDPFTQADNGARSTFTGTGLGLPIVKRLLEYMGGRIEIDSKLGEGTKVSFTLPFYVDGADKATEEKRISNLKGGVEGSRMLLVEDNQLNLEIAKYMLEDKGITVDTAENGLIAVKKFEKSDPFTYDLILMDIMMPELDGIEATKRIRKLQRADAKLVPIVALSANTYAEDNKASKDAGMDDHLAKPIDVERLYEVITKQKKIYDSRRIERPYSQLFTGDDLK